MYDFNSFTFLAYKLSYVCDRILNVTINKNKRKVGIPSKEGKQSGHWLADILCMCDVDIDNLE